MKSRMGWGIANLRFQPASGVAPSRAVRPGQEERRVKVDDETYDLRGHIFDSFGEDAFRVELRRLNRPVK